MTTVIEICDHEFELRARKNFESQGFMRSIGARISRIDPGQCEITLPFSDVLSQQRGYFHGGIIATLADVSGGYAAFSIMDSAQTNVTVDIKINFLAPATGDSLLAEAKVVKAGRTLTVCQSEVYTKSADGTKKFCVTALSTYMAIDYA
jgi:uncharacterized protein (TIGR00369 family)